MHAKTNRGDVGSGEVGGLRRRTKQRPILLGGSSSMRLDRPTTIGCKSVIHLGCSDSCPVAPYTGGPSKATLNDPNVRISTASTSKEIFLGLLGSHDRIINHLRLYESFSTCPRSNSKAPRSRRLGYYRQFPGENMRFCLVVGSTHMGLCYDRPAINHRRSLQPFAERTCIRERIHSPMRGYPVFQKPIPWLSRHFLCVYKHASVMAVYRRTSKPVLWGYLQ